jgi:hypothetical protein
LGRLDDRYRDLFGLLIDMYRHGLAHTHLTKTIKFRDRNNKWIVLGWALTDEDSHVRRHLTVQRRDARFFSLWIHVPLFVKHTLRAINLYRSDLQRAGVRSRLFARFKQGYIGTAAVFQEPSPPGSSGKHPPKSKSKIRLILNRYSEPGIQWVRTLIASGDAWDEG